MPNCAYMKTYLTIILGVLLLTGCDDVHFTQPTGNAQFGFEISGDKIFRVNRQSGEITVYWLEAGKLKLSSNYSPHLADGSYEDENGKQIYYLGNGKLSYSSSDYVEELLAQRKSEQRNEKTEREEQHFQLRFIRDAVLKTSDVSGLVAAFVHVDGKLESVPEEIRKLTSGMLLMDEKEKHVVYDGNGILDYSNDKVTEAIMRKYPGIKSP